MRLASWEVGGTDTAAGFLARKTGWHARVPFTVSHPAAATNRIYVGSATSRTVLIARSERGYVGCTADGIAPGGPSVEASGVKQLRPRLPVRRLPLSAPRQSFLAPA
jgi:hypothetical protein